MSREVIYPREVSSVVVFGMVWFEHVKEAYFHHTCRLVHILGPRVMHHYLHEASSLM